MVWSPLPAEGAEAIAWQRLEPGLELTVHTVASSDFLPVELVMLRLDPRQVRFILLTASAEGTPASLSGWADRHGLIAAINASMYLPDTSTSTGYMRQGDHVNNPRVVNKFGAFFVAEPRPLPARVASDLPEPPASPESPEAPEPPMPAAGPAAAAIAPDRESPDYALPLAGVLDRMHDPWEAWLPRYTTVVQNYRLISADGRVLWAPGGPSYAISAVGEDQDGHILFIHCREPVTGVQLGQMLQELPLHLRVVMYVEGGPQAGLLVRAGNVNQVWMGRHFADFWTSGNKNAPLPNVIGVTRRERAQGPPSLSTTAMPQHEVP